MELMQSSQTQGTSRCPCCLQALYPFMVKLSMQRGERHAYCPDAAAQSDTKPYHPPRTWCHILLPPPLAPLAVAGSSQGPEVLLLPPLRRQQCRRLAAAGSIEGTARIKPSTRPHAVLWSTISTTQAPQGFPPCQAIPYTQKAPGITLAIP